MMTNLGKLCESGAEQGPSDSESSAFDLLVYLNIVENMSQISTVKACFSRLLFWTHTVIV